jgi:glycine cleavage system regulatory protein
MRNLNLPAIGNDRPGLVEKLATRTSSAPMSAEILFHCEARLTASPDFNARALKHELEKLSDDLMVDISRREML